MTDETYAQLNEDRRLWNALKDCPHKTYVDVGASHPTENSVTKIFYDAGWRGVNVEPGPYFDLLCGERSRDLNLEAVIGFDDLGTGEKWLHASTTHPDLASTKPIPNSGLGKFVRCYPLDEVLEVAMEWEAMEWEDEIGFLKIDVEGAELEVLESNNWNEFRPLIVVVEAIDAYTRKPNHHEWEPILLDNGYGYAYFDGVNRWYYRLDHPEYREPLQIDLPGLPGYPKEDGANG